MPLVAVQFKGSGFYKTDHGRKSKSRSDKNGAEITSADSKEAKTSDAPRASDVSGGKGKVPSTE